MVYYVQCWKTALHFTSPPTQSYSAPILQPSTDNIQNVGSPTNDDQHRANSEGTPTGRLWPEAAAASALCGHLQSAAYYTDEPQGYTRGRHHTSQQKIGFQPTGCSRHMVIIFSCFRSLHKYIIFTTIYTHIHTF